MDTFEQELCRNDAMKDILDRKGKLKRVKRGGLVVRAVELATFKCTFPVIASALEYLQINGDGKPGIHLSVLFAI
jgi:hypothetical protein